MYEAMAAFKFKRTILLALSIFCVMYIMLTDIAPVDSNRGFVYFPSDIANTTVFNKTRGKRDDGNCVLMDGYKMEQKPVDLRVIIITYNRPLSLWRLLETLEQAYYENDRVVFEIWLDRSKSHLVHNETLQTALDYRFSKGRCHVFVHPAHVGITGQWLSTWCPVKNSSEIAVILEDDLTVSQYFYRYLKLVHRKYSHKHDIYGFSLQGKSLRHSDGKCCLDVPQENKVFLYPTLGTSGFSPNNRNWLQFIHWYKEIIRNNKVVPLIENHISTKWYKELARKGKADSMWEMEYLYYTRRNKEFTLYPNFPDHRGLSFNWFEDGLHSTGLRVKSKELEIKSLVTTWNLDYDKLPNNPIYTDDSGNVIR